jgi:hypothetical protein
MTGWFKQLFASGDKTEGSKLTRWALLIRTESGKDVEFFEIRQNDASIWFAKGLPFTMGESELKTLATKIEADALWLELTEHYKGQSFECVFSGEYQPGELDYDLLQKAIEVGAKRAFLEICATHDAEKITGFALYSDSGGMTICNAAMSNSSFDEDDEDFEYYRTNPNEWPLETDVGLLLAYRMILVPSYEYLEMPFETEVPDFVDRFFETVVRALEKLDASQLFGTGPERENFLLLFGASDGGPIKDHVRRLNPPTVFARFAACFDD